MPVVKIHITDYLDHLTIQKKGIEKLLMNINPKERNRKIVNEY